MAAGSGWLSATLNALIVAAGSGWLSATLIALIVAVGAVATDQLVRRHRRRFLEDLVHRLGLGGTNDLIEELDPITRSVKPLLFALPVALFAGISAIGLNYALFPSENAPFLQHNIFVLSAQFGTPAQIMEYQRQAVTALFAGFIGAFAFCLFRFYQDIVAGRFSPGSLVLASGTLLAASVATVVMWHGVAAIGAGTLVSFSSSTLFVVSVIVGAALARPGPLLLQQAWARLWDGTSRHRRPGRCKPSTD